jgi:hypothetical protein
VAEAEITEFWRAVKNVLDPVLGFRLKEGKVDGGISRRRTGCIYPGLEQELPEQVDDAQMFVIVRLFEVLQPQRSEHQPLGNPASLATLVQLVRSTWREHYTDNPGGIWFSRVVGAEYDLDRNMVEITFMAHTRNVGILP